MSEDERIVDDENIEIKPAVIQPDNQIITSPPVEPISPPSTTTTLGSVFTGVLVFVIIVITVGLIYYLTNQPLINPFPVSIFKYNDKVVIRPALLTYPVNDNQYLTVGLDQLNFGSSPCTAGLGLGYRMGVGANALEFTGSRTDPRSQWILSQFSAGTYSKDQKIDANSNLSYGFGNRFFLRNSSNPDPNDLSARVRYQLNNETTQGLVSNSIAPAVSGSKVYDCNWFETELLVYFMPTNTPDIYYILYPMCSDDFLGTNVKSTINQTNNGICSIRPFAPLNDSNGTQIKFASQCNYGNPPSGVFNPVQANGTLYPNILLMNALPNNLSPAPPFPNPNVLLFNITLA